jgi:rfaE bifunctional protein kinase chain/domain
VNHSLQTTLLQIIKELGKRKIMVIGDMVADVYLEGKISRISREAPVLILEHQTEKVVPGGAANAVHNVATLSGSVYAVGVVGDDVAGQDLIRILDNKSVNTSGFIVDKSRPTITKTRIMAGGQATVRQQVVRIDKENKQPLDQDIQQALHDYIVSHINEMDGVVISDYGSNTITPDMITLVISTCQDRGIPCIVDSRYNIMAYHGVTVVKQNESEAAAVVGYDINDRETLLRAGNTILTGLDAQAVLITLGADGMGLFQKTGEFIHIPVTNISEVYDVTGAGDTVVSTMILALAAGASYGDAARLSNFAAGIVVKKLGTATTTPRELSQAICDHFEENP